MSSNQQAQKRMRGLRTRKQSKKHEKVRLRIETLTPSRTLRRSAREQLERERAPRLWIWPWISDPTYRFGRVYARASFLGLPSELRQQILYESLDREELEWAPKEAKMEENTRMNLTMQVTARRGDLRREKAVRLSSSLSEVKLSTGLGRQIGAL